MATTSKRSHKHFQLDSIKIKRAQKVLRADTETEAIERALDLVIAEHEKRFDPGEKFGDLQRTRKLLQGDAGLSFYRRVQNHNL